MTKKLVKEIKQWLTDFDLATSDSGEPDQDTLDGSAYILLQKILKENITYRNN